MINDDLFFSCFKSMLELNKVNLICFHLSFCFMTTCVHVDWPLGSMEC